MIGIIVPAPNEEATIGSCIQSLLATATPQQSQRERGKTLNVSESKNSRYGTSEVTEKNTMKVM